MGVGAATFCIIMTVLSAPGIDHYAANDGERYARFSACRGGIEFLWREHLRLRQDAHETIGFSVLAVSLIEEARLLGLDVRATPTAIAS